MPVKTDGVLKFLTSGKFENPRDEAVMDQVVRYIIYNVALMIGAIFLILFGVSVITGGNTIRGIADLFIGFMCILNIFLLRTRLPFTICGLIPLVPFGVLCSILMMNGGEGGFAGLWVYAYPLIVIFIMGLLIGSILSGLLLLGIIAAAFIPGLAGFTYTLPIAFRILSVYVLVLILTMVYEQIRIMKDQWARQLTVALKSERDEITAMKDNLKTGIFLMDQELLIQPAYSKALEQVLGLDNLQGKKFTDLLASSIKAKERETLEDYFGMVLNRSFDAKMLEDINPLVEFDYVNPLSGEVKTLRGSFGAVDRGGGTFFVLGTLEDITTEKLLQQQLKAEEGRLDEEMRALFQIIQVEPGVFNDFVEDTEYEFDRINQVLKNNKLTTPEVIVEIYQSVHAIKSNALILGLDNFSGKLHELESEIKTLRDNETVSFEDILHITVELEKIMKEMDKFRETIRRIQSFKAHVGDSRRQDRYVLVETLTKACEKTAAAQNKKARLVVEDMDGRVLEYGPRRAIKEVLTQLVRNAVSHGLESPEERVRLGKDPQGLIRLSISYGENRIHLRLTDDGRGLDFEKIRRQAEKLHLFRGDEAVQDKNRLIKIIFSPGFSTAEEVDAHAGRGIGLNLVRERIKELGGSIKLQSEPGKGTTFHIFIPLEMNPELHKAS
jgi:two-component system chemotaxis sensor kinase CheA